jgi:hypothetical protein
MVAVLGPFEALPCYIHTYIHILTTRNYNNYQTEVRRILIALINVYNSLTNLHTPQIAATRSHFLGILLTYIYMHYSLNSRHHH